MMRRLCMAVCLMLLPAALLSNALRAQAPTPPADPQPAARALAERIDQLIEARWVGNDIQPTATIDDAQFLRRLSLDLTGRIPTLLELRDFIDPTNENPNKRPERIDRLLSDASQQAEAYAPHFATFWRSVMLHGTNQKNQSPAFESWLRQRLVNNTRYDQIASELLTSPQGAGGFGPAAFYQANENKAENLAGATARLFLGVSIECAECHNHPYAKWQRQQFWEYAAFFANTQPAQQQNPAAALDSREIRIPDTDKVAKARFLDGSVPQWQPDVNSRTTLVKWMTFAQNPYFAKAAVDHLWQYFFGVSLLEPILEANQDSPPAHPELLDTLAKAFTDSGYDLKFLIRSITRTKAYQRASAGGKGTKEEVYLFARMPVRGLSPEQLYSSVIGATDIKDEDAASRKRQGNNAGEARMAGVAEFVTKFASQGKRTETHTSILHALFLMNGKFLAERTRLEGNKALNVIAHAPTPTLRRVETLYLMVLSRLPRAEEAERLVRYIDSSADVPQAVTDVYWSLLNSAEFFLNH